MTTYSYKYAYTDNFGLLHRGKKNAASKKELRRELGLPWWNCHIWPSNQTEDDVVTKGGEGPTSLLPRFRHIKTTPEMILYGKAGADSIVPGILLLILGVPIIFLPIFWVWRLIGLVFALGGISNLIYRIEMKIFLSPSRICIKKTQYLFTITRKNEIAIFPTAVILEREAVFREGNKCVYAFVSIRNTDGSITPVDCSSYFKFEKKMAQEIADFFNLPIEENIKPGATLETFL